VWKINQDFIAKNLCVNIDKPSMGCRGKCQLNKQLQKIDTESQNDKSHGQLKISVSAVDLFFETKLFELKNIFCPASLHHYGGLTESRYHFIFLSGKFKPPVSIIS